MQPNSPQVNPGRFMNPTGQTPGQGSALLQLMRLRSAGQQVPGMTASPTNLGGIQMSQPPQGVGGPPATQQGGGGQPMPGAPVAPQNAPQGASMAQPVQQTPTTPDDNLQLALNALSNYIKGHTDVLRAKHGVDLQKARASQIAAQGQPVGGS